MPTLGQLYAVFRDRETNSKPSGMSPGHTGCPGPLGVGLG